VFRVAILAGLFLALAFALFGGASAEYAATQKSPQGSIHASAVAGAILFGAVGFLAGVTIAPIGLSIFHFLRINRPRYRLRTLLIVLALGPPVLAVAWSTVGLVRERLTRQAAVPLPPPPYIPPGSPAGIRGPHVVPPEYRGISFGAGNPSETPEIN
jgi:hypothetical protein